MTNVRFQRIDCSAKCSEVHNVGTPVNKPLWLIVDGWVIGGRRVWLIFTFPTLEHLFQSCCCGVNDCTVGKQTNVMWGLEKVASLFFKHFYPVLYAGDYWGNYKCRDTYGTVSPSRDNLLPVWSYSNFLSDRFWLLRLFWRNWPISCWWMSDGQGGGQDLYFTITAAGGLGLRFYYDSNSLGWLGLLAASISDCSPSLPTPSLLLWEILLQP